MNETKPSKAEVWKTIYANLLAYDLVPVNVRLHPDDISVDIQLQPDQFDDVASALALFDLPSGEVWSLDNDGPHLWSKGEAGEFYAWGRYSNRRAQSKLLPGWNVSIYCNARTANYPLPAAELVATFVDPAACDCFAPLSGEVTSPFGPCRGLAADLRDNTCTNFAAEYVGYPVATAGLTVGEVFTPATEYRRLCTPCADTINSPVERHPLTTTPGGIQVEQAVEVTR